MGRKIHFLNVATNRIICGEPTPKQDKTRSGKNYHRQPKYTQKPTEVTCERCKEHLIHDSQYFLCPMCSCFTKTFIIKEVMSEIYANMKDPTLDISAQRNLISITCPVCDNTMPVTENWRNVSDRMKIGGYGFEQHCF
jgi:hypothetical protein